MSDLYRARVTESFEMQRWRGFKAAFLVLGMNQAKKGTTLSNDRWELVLLPILHGN